jgi:GT2 family glycosyltransferase
VTIRPLHVVVVAYHRPRQLDRCLAAIGGAAATTVVDNSRSAGVCAVAVRHGAEYIDPRENLGFGAGVNVALRRLLDGPRRDVLLLNPDATLAPRDLGTLAEYLHRPGNERVAAVSPRLNGPDGGEQRVVWPFPSPARAWAEAFGLGRLPGRHTFAIGAVLLLRWEALRQVGLFDERFFLYAEETDWQRRALTLGWRSELCDGVVASHIGAGTMDDPLRREALFHAAHETYIRKWFGRRGWWAYRSAACLGAAARAVVLRRERRAEAARRARLYLRGPHRSASLVLKG